MKEFGGLDARHKITLMTRLITTFADSGYLDGCHGSVAEWARAAGISARTSFEYGLLRHALKSATANSVVAPAMLGWLAKRFEVRLL